MWPQFFQAAKKIPVYRYILLYTGIETEAQNFEIILCFCLVNFSVPLLKYRLRISISFDCLYIREKLRLNLEAVRQRLVETFYRKNVFFACFLLFLFSHQLCELQKDVFSVSNCSDFEEKKYFAWISFFFNFDFLTNPFWRKLLPGDI